MSSMKSAPSSMENALKRYALNLTSAINQAKEAKESEQYARHAFSGGDRTFFDSELAIKTHYDSIRAEARERGKGHLDAVLRDMKDTRDCALRINTAKAAECQAALPLIRDDESLLRFASETERRDDFTCLSAVAAYTDKEGKSTPSSRTIRARLDAYDDALGAIVQKTEKYITRALNGDSTYASGWDGWIRDAIKDADTAYERLQGALDGETEKGSLAEMFSVWAESKMN